MLHLKVKVVVFAIGLGVEFAQIPTALANPISNDAELFQDQSKPSPEQCWRAYRKLTMETAPNEEVSERTMALMKQCQASLRVLPNPDTPLPKINECIDYASLVFDTLRQNKPELLAEIPMEKQRSLSRCREILQVQLIPSESMLPTLKVGDRVMIDRLAYQSQLPQRGDVILFEPTKTLRDQQFNSPFLKRVIGLPGETVEVRNGFIYINGKALQEKYLMEKPQYELEATVVPLGNYFVLGDNRNNSYDSHYWGFVPRDVIIGKAPSVLCPIERQNILNESDYLNSERNLLISSSFKNSKLMCEGFSSVQPTSRQSVSSLEALQAKLFISSMNKNQQRFFLENNNFTIDSAQLKFNVLTTSHKMVIKTPDPKKFVQNILLAEAPGLKSYIGIVAIGKVMNSREQGFEMYSILCESNQPTTAMPQTALSVSATGEPICPVGYSVIR
jgi:signal peptidase I